MRTVSLKLLRRTLLSAFLGALIGFSALPVWASGNDSSRPPAREELENIKPSSPVTKGDDKAGLPFDIRKEAVKEAALSYGARGGLAWRGYFIRQELETTAGYMDKVFDFRLLLIPAPSGLMIEPPVVTEDDNAMIINASGQEAAVADRIYNISANARIVAAPRDWRNYLERDWGTDVKRPPDILMPDSKEEREAWIGWIREGWDKGIQQADDIFEADLFQLTADYQGMVRYRILLSQGMISPPYALQVDRGITGGGNRMRVGDRAVQITGRPEFIPGSNTWQPASR